MFRPVVASRLPDDLDKRWREEKAKVEISRLFHLYEHVLKKKKTKFVPLPSQPGRGPQFDRNLSAYLTFIFIFSFFKFNIYYSCFFSHFL